MADSRYELLSKIASGGMATVYVGRVRGAAGFWRLVALKRAHPHLVEQREFREMFVAEALLASRIHHTNVVSVLDVEERDGELLLAMDYVEGSSLSHLASVARERGQPMPASIVVRIVLDATTGLQAAHDLTDEDGKPLGVVHRDVSPHNILIGTDGVGRIADFGIAKVLHQGGGATASGVLKGKLSYMAPEYVADHVIDAQSDVYSMGIVLWEMLAGRPLFRGKNELETLSKITTERPAKLSEVRPELGTRFDEVVAKALERERERRWASAGAFGRELERAAQAQGLLASHGDVAEFLKWCLGPELAERKASIRAGTSPSGSHAADQQTASLRNADGVETRAVTPVAISEQIATLPSAEVEVVPPSNTATAPLPLVRPAEQPAVDATQPSFAHSRIGPVPGLGQRSPRRLGLWAAVVAVAIGAGGLLFWRRTASVAEVASSAPAPTELPSEPEPGPVAAPPALGPAPVVVEPPSEPSARARPTSPPRERAKERPSKADAGPGPAPPASAAFPPAPSEWSPDPNPYK